LGTFFAADAPIAAKASGAAIEHLGFPNSRRTAVTAEESLNASPSSKYIASFPIGRIPLFINSSNIGSTPDHWG
jgi:hypothetical protein